MMDQVGGALAKAGARAMAVGVLGDGDVDEEDPRAASRVAAKAKAKHGVKAKGTVPAKPASKAKVGAKAPAPAKAVGPPVAPPAKASSSDASEFVVSASSSSAPAPPVPVPGRRPRRERDWKDAIGGGHCFFEEYKGLRIGRKKEYANWIFKCPYVGPGHGFPSCERTMGLGPTNAARHGDIEPLAFLHVWRDTPPNLERGHRKTEVDAASVDTFVAEHRDELRALLSEFLSP